MILKTEIFNLFETIKFGGVEFKTRIEQIEKDQRLFAIIGPDQKLIHSTFRDFKFDVLDFNPNDLKLKFRISKKPDYLEVRSNQGSTFSIYFEDGVYSCEPEMHTKSEYNKVIVEAYYKSK